VRRTARRPRREATTGIEAAAPPAETVGSLLADEVPVAVAGDEAGMVAAPCVAAGVESGALRALAAFGCGEIPALPASLAGTRVVVVPTALGEGVVKETVVTGVGTCTDAVGVDTAGCVTAVGTGSGVVTVTAGVVTVTAGVDTVTVGVVTVVGTETVGTETVGTETVGTVSDAPIVTVARGVPIVVASGTVERSGEPPARVAPRRLAATKPATAMPHRPAIVLPFTRLPPEPSFVLSPSLSLQHGRTPSLETGNRDQSPAFLRRVTGSDRGRGDR
jgi:hypothetical protein